MDPGIITDLAWENGKCNVARTYVRILPSVYATLPLHRWSDYKSEEIVVMDDADFNIEYRGAELRALLSYGTPSVEIKYSHARFNARIVIITSNYPPHEYVTRLGIDKDDEAPYVARIENAILLYNCRKSFELARNKLPHALCYVLKKVFSLNVTREQFQEALDSQPPPLDICVNEYTDIDY